MCFSGSRRLFSSPIMARRSRSAEARSTMAFCTLLIYHPLAVLAREHEDHEGGTKGSELLNKSSVTSPFSAVKNGSCLRSRSVS